MAWTLLRDRLIWLEKRVALVRGKNAYWLNGAVSDCLIEALVIAEDKRFWSHKGVDVAAMIRAVYCVVFRRRFQGASTVEQQFVRTLTNDRAFSLGRKLREIALACVIGSFVSKREIAVLYLCCAYYGWRMNSLGEACLKTGFNAGTIGYRHSAELVARLKYPEPQRASAAWQRSIQRRANYILRKASGDNV